MALIRWYPSYPLNPEVGRSMPKWHGVVSASHIIGFLFMKLVRIVAPHFVAGFEHDEIIVRRAAPIIKYMVGWSPRKVWDYCKSKGWKYKTLT